MSAILGIDAAWTETEPSGVALVADVGSKWKCLAVAPSYGSFVEVTAGGKVDWSRKSFKGGMPEPARLLEAARNLLGGEDVALVTVDMPLATCPVVKRRAADDAISRCYGRFGCGTHSPGRDRPGAMGQALTRGFVESGYQLATEPDAPEQKEGPLLIEVYPHPALLVLLARTYRVPYKVSRRQKYWPRAENEERKQNLLNVFNEILGALRKDIRINKSRIDLPEAVPSFTVLKRYEDAIDAMICAWVGIKFLEGRIVAHGDETARIWTPPLPGHEDEAAE